MDDELTELGERLRAMTIAHGAPAVFRMFGDYVHDIGDFLDDDPNASGRSRRRRAHPNRVQRSTPLPNSPSHSSESDSLFSTPPPITFRHPREPGSSPDRLWEPGPPTTIHHRLSNPVPPSPTPPQVRRALSGPVPALSSPALSLPPRIPTNSTPPTPTSMRSRHEDDTQPTIMPHQVRQHTSRDHEEHMAPHHGARRPELRLVEEAAMAEQAKDTHGLRNLAYLVRVQDPTIGTLQEVHYHFPGQRGPRGRWYIILVGREVGVFNDWSAVQAATNGVSGTNFQSVADECTAYAKFIEALNARQVCIVNKVLPHTPNN